MNNDTKNLFLAIALSVMVLVGWQYFVGAPKLTQQRTDLKEQQALPPRPTSEAGAPAAASARRGDARRPAGRRADRARRGRSRRREIASGCACRQPSPDRGHGEPVRLDRAQGRAHR